MERYDSRTGMPMAPPVAPVPSANEADRRGMAVTQESIAKGILEKHRQGLEARRERDLISEKLILHIDGSGDWQWADIYKGQRVEIPRMVSAFRRTENLLRPIINNAIAHHTTMTLKFMAQASSDRRAKKKSIIDTLWANHLAFVQDFNGLTAEALSLAFAAGFCPMHCYWRDDVMRDWYDPVAPKDPEMQEMGGPGFDVPPGMVDCFVGNPFSTVFDTGARRNSIRWMTYERVLPADVVREHFGHVPGIEGLEGSDKVPSANEFQRIAQKWMMEGLGIHGSPTQRARQGGAGDELVTIIAKECAPGTPDYPEGRLQIIGVPGFVDFRRSEGGGAKQAILLADQPLPGGEFSAENIYSELRGSDVHGKPWVEPIDELQVQLNIAKASRWEQIEKMRKAPIVAPGGVIADDMREIDGYAMMEIEPGLASWRPRVVEWPQSILVALDKEIDDLRRAMYTIGGYQSVSRGESPGSRMAYRAIVALQEADRSVHGPLNVRFQRSVVNFMKKCWAQFKAYGDVPWVVEIAGDEYGYLAEQYIDRTKMSDYPPNFTLVNSFGPSPELRAQEVLELMQTRGADGEPFLRTDEARKQYPNQYIFDAHGDPTAVQRRRAKTVAEQVELLATQVREQMGYQQWSMADPQAQQMGMQVFYLIEQEYPRFRDDDLEAHIATLTEIIQDETADPVARYAAQMRQEMFFQWQEMMAMGMGAPYGSQMQGQGQLPAGGPADDPMGRSEIMAEGQGGQPPEGAEGMVAA